MERFVVLVFGTKELSFLGRGGGSIHPSLLDYFLHKDQGRKPTLHVFTCMPQRYL